MASQKAGDLYKKHKGALKGAQEGQVVTRFPPEPSGYLHIGHIKAAMLNFHYAKMYNGRMILRFDDTNPSKENEDFVDNIKQDLVTLEIYPDHVSFTSDWFPQMADLMKKMIEDGNAYLDNTPVEEMRAQRNEGIPSNCRDKSPEENLELWSQFIEGQLQEYAVRGKIDYTNKNKCLRDPVFYRFNATPHLHTGTQWKVYPTYDFACPIVDSLEGVTHCLRTSEYNDRNPMYHWVQESLGIRKVEICDFSKLNFVNTVLSKRKLQKLVDTGIVEGWFDPRFPTVQGIVRRGLTVQALKDFMLEQGHSKRTVMMDWTTLWAKNKQIIDPVAPRYPAISTESLCFFTLENGPEAPYEEPQPLHQRNAELGNCAYIYSKTILVEFADVSTIQSGEKVTLIKWGNAIVDVVEETEESFRGHRVKLHMKGRLILEDKDYKSTKKLNWLAAVDALTETTLVEYDVLITKAKVEETDDIDQLINPNSKFDTHAFGLPEFKAVNPGTILQIERRGFYIVDKAGDSPCLIYVPDGKSKGNSVLGSKVDPKALAKGSEQGLSKKQQAKLDKKAKQQQAKAKREEAKAEESAQETKPEESKTE